MLATLPPQYGLYSSTIPIFMYAMLGSSKHLAVGPVAVVSLLVAEALESTIEADDENRDEKAVDIAIILSLLVGCISIVLAIFRAGVVSNFISHAVLVGFTNGAAIVIGLSQLKHLLGFSIPRFSYPLQTLVYALTNIKQTQPATIIMGTASIILLLILKYTKRWWAKKPVMETGKSETMVKLEKWSKLIVKLVCDLSALVVVVIGTLVTEYLYKSHGYNETSLPIVGYVPGGFPSPKVPPVKEYGSEIPHLFTSALVICVLGFMESYAVADTYARKVDLKVDSNRELNGLGFANLVGSFFNAYPVTGGFSRTAVQYDSGCRSPIAMIMSAIVVLISLAALTTAFFYMPKNALAAIVFVAVSGLFNFSAIKESYFVSRTDFWAIIITFIGTIAFGVEIGLGIGFATSVILILQRLAFPHSALLGEIESGLGNEKVYRNLKRFPEARKIDRVAIFRIDAPLWFASSATFFRRVDSLLQDPEVDQVILDFSAVDFIDLAGMEQLEQIRILAARKHVGLIIASMKGPVRDTLMAYNKYLEDHNPGNELFPWLEEPGSIEDGARQNYMVATIQQAIASLAQKNTSEGQPKDILVV